MGQHYTVRLYMHYDVRPTEEWSSTTEWEIDGTITSDDVTAVADQIVEAYQPLLLDNVVLDRVVISTWAPDSVPYDPETVRTISYGVFGEQEFILTSPVDDDIVLFMRKQVTRGRTGKFQLRGCLTLAALSVESGSWTLEGVALAAFILSVADFSAALAGSSSLVMIGVSLLSTTYPATPEGERQVPVKVYSDEPVVRTVTGIALIGPTERQDTQ